MARRVDHTGYERPAASPGRKWAQCPHLPGGATLGLRDIAACAGDRTQMALIPRIDKDHRRFREIVRGRIRENLRKYVSRGDMITRRGKDRVTIPMPHIDIPRFVFGDSQKGGVGQGEGEVGDEVGGQPGEGQSGAGEAGEGEGAKELEVEVTMEELAAILGDELELPRIEPKGNKSLETAKDRYVGLRTTGPESLRNFKATFKRALKRLLSSPSWPSWPSSDS